MPDFPGDNGQTGGRTDLERRLEEARRRNRPVTPEAKAAAVGDGMGRGARSGIEFAAALVVSVALGIALDRWLHIAPVMTLIMVVLGFGAGILNVYRSMNGMTYGTGSNKPPAKAAPAEDDTDETRE